jgi:hypothetical protein
MSRRRKKDPVADLLRIQLGMVELYALITNPASPQMIELAYAAAAAREHADKLAAQLREAIMKMSQRDPG